MHETKVEKNENVQDKSCWRELSVNDIKSVAGVADNIHPDLPERDEVFAERIQLFPEGCLGLSESNGNDLCGYVISHPIRRFETPALNSLLGKIASDADQYYMHDLAILPRFQGRGSAHECMDKLSAIAKRYDTRRPASSPSTAQSDFGALLGSCRCRWMMYWRANCGSTGMMLSTLSARMRDISGRRWQEMQV